ncbi:hypothetical protein HTY52_17190 [Cupriavidus taiwanensis]|uniref:hypothetical protein n=1 Tax=Cupriavidus taiwanensis TaxID=164546 RepID=UPI0015724EE8|nr:hypothetical protein [Cupriavidus taiwanensis]NSX15823.1 hypothetical protein [Cupriavidus taiwanensis]
MSQSSIEPDPFIPPRLDDPLSQFSPETRRAARGDALPVPRQLLLLNLLDQADAVARGTACVLTLATHSECDAQEEGSVALQAATLDALRGLCQASLELLADKVEDVAEGIEEAMVG